MEKYSLIKKIIGKYTFQNRKKEHVDFCPCYNGTKCHKILENELICLFCYCPEYEINEEFLEGRCKIENPLGKYFYHPNLPYGKIWDCSECITPQKKEYVSNFLKRITKNNLEFFLSKNFNHSKEIFDFLINCKDKK